MKAAELVNMPEGTVVTDVEGDHWTFKGGIWTCGGWWSHVLLPVRYEPYTVVKSPGITEGLETQLGDARERIARVRDVVANLRRMSANRYNAAAVCYGLVADDLEEALQ